jgi:hypothetical protein
VALGKWEKVVTYDERRVLGFSFLRGNSLVDPSN